jgi:photosystem II stability/assembly factor-like uncharacterized protein
MSERVPQCRAAMPFDTLSAWYDHDLDSATDRRVQDHVDSCTACQDLLRNFQTTARTLQTDHPPDMQQRVWRGIQHKKSAARVRLPLATLSGVAIVAVLAVSIFVLFSRHQGTPPLMSDVTKTVAPTITPTVDILHPNPAQGWVVVPSLSFASGIVFAASDPLRGYACGNGSANPTTTPVQISRTMNGGRTWATPENTPLIGQWCAIFTSPSNPQDVFLEGYNFQNGIGTSNLGYARSLDGGETWKTLTVPAGDGASSVLDGTPVWAGTTLFIESNGTPHILAASIADGPFQWVDAHAPFYGGGNFAIGGIYGLGNTLYALNTPYKAPVTISKTSDNGASWSTFTPQGLSGGGYSPVTANDGKTVVVETQAGEQLAISTDAGLKWVPLPTLPPNTNIYEDIAHGGIHIMPDGVIYTSLQDTSGSGKDSLYLLPPGGTAWQALPGTDWGGFLAISWNLAGHASAAWRLIPPKTIQGSTGIEYRGFGS